MCCVNRIIALVILFFSLLQVSVANGKDPIGWSQAGIIPNRTTLYTTYNLQYTILNNLGFSMPSPLTVDHHMSSDEFILKDECSGQQLPAGGSCVISIAFTPKEIGKKSVSIAIAYGNNTVKIPLLETTTTDSKDPILWSQDGSVPVESTTHTTYRVTYQITSNLPFTMTSPLMVTHHASSDEFVLRDKCSGLKLESGESCTLEVSYLPITVGVKSFNMSVSYGNFVLQLPPLETKAHSNGTPNVVASVERNLPPFVRVSGGYEVKFHFKNIGTAEASNLAFTKNYSNNFLEHHNDCGSVLQVGETCTISGIFSSTTLGSASVGVGVNYSGGNAAIHTTTKVVDPGLGRIVTFVNNCNQDVWFGVRGGVAEDICVDDTDCPTGSVCRNDAG